MQVVPYPFQEKDKELIQTSLIKQQGNVIFPTETYYAVGCMADATTAVKHVYRLKKRSKDLPLLLLVNSWEMFERYVTNLNDYQQEFLKSYWPGALTAIVQVSNMPTPELNYNGDTLAFRMTSCPIAQELISLCDTPLVGTSANRSGEDEIDTFSEAHRQFGDHVELYIDGGQTPGGATSTIISMVDTDRYKIIRPGAIQLND